MTNGSGGITPTGGLGMLWYPVKQFGDFRVKLQFREGRTDGGSSNGGVFLRFPDPRVPLAQRPDSCSRQGSAATDQAWVAIYCGHEFQMFDGIEPNSEPQKTGSVYNFQPNTIDKIGEAEAQGRVGGLRDRGRRPDVQDLSQWRADQHVRQLAGQSVQPWR